jgi:pimeloyl-ACP methyl ester carboxylesterase
MTTFVLVHGSWHGGWCWRKVTPFLWQAGHEVHTLTLTGLGERVHLLNDRVGLDTHIQDVVNHLEYEDLHDVILVGHSYAGMVIGAVGAQAAHRIAHLVYLDAINPRDGESFYDHEPGFKPWALGRAYQVNGTDVLPPNLPTDLGVTDTGDIVWMSERLRPHPLLAYAQPVTLPADGTKKLARSYIWCTDSKFLQREVDLARGDGWQVYELNTSHEAMITVPNELAQLLLEIANKK